MKTTDMAALMSPSTRKRSAGFSLILSLIMLAVIAILGIAATRIALNEERSSRNDRDRMLAMQAAEVALKDAETELYAASTSSGTNTTRLNAGILFNGFSRNGFSDGCSTGTNAGLCLPTDNTVAGVKPVWQTVNFLADAQDPTSSTVKSVTYGAFTGQSFPSNASGVSRHPPRYIVEVVNMNNHVNGGPANCSEDEASTSACYMYRVTAIGFGTNENTQVVLQAVISTTP